ncbi:MAG TPA: GFA family protein [Bdellovibrio sp.]|nr:GFA family protein [Bdellovibrio sp.]
MSAEKCYKGSCLCKAVTYEITTPIKFVIHDHCTICRRASGAAFVTWGGVKAEQFKLTSGSENLTSFKYSADSERQFCKHCGSQLFFKAKRWEGEVHFTRATINEEMDEKPKGHVFYSDKVNWFQFEDGLPRYGGQSGMEPLT